MGDYHSPLELKQIAYEETLQENLEKFTDYINDVCADEETFNKHKILISKYEEATEQIHKNLYHTNIGTIFDNYLSDAFAKYFVLNHLLYLAVKELENNKTDFIDNFNRMAEADNAEEYNTFINSYLEKIKQTDQYLLMFDDHGNILENLNELEPFTFLVDSMDNTEEHDLLELTDPVEFKRLTTQKREARLKAIEEEKAKAKREEEEAIRRKDELLAEHEKNDIANESYKQDINDAQKNAETAREYITKLDEFYEPLKRKYNELNWFVSRRDATTKDLKHIINDVEADKQLTETQIKYLNEYIASNLIFTKALKEKASGDTDIYNRIIDSDPKILFHEVYLIIKNSNLVKELFGSADKNQNLNNMRKFFSAGGFAEKTNDFFNKFEIKMLFEGKSAIRNKVNSILDKKSEALTLNEKNSQRLEFILKVAKAEIELLKNEALQTPTGKISPNAIHQISKIVACTQIISNDQTQKDFYDKLLSLPDKDKELYIEQLASKLEKSEFINSILQTSDPSKNVSYLIELISSSDKLANKLNELNYSKAIFSGKEIAKQTTLNTLEKQLEKDIFDRNRLEEEKKLALGQMKDGFYDVGRESYLYTKTEMVKLAETLKDFANPENEVFSLITKLEPTDNAEENKANDALKEALIGIFSGLQEVSATLLRNGQSIDDFYRDNTDGFLRDNQDLPEIISKLDLMLTSCDKVLEYDISDTEEFQKIYSSIVKTRNKVDEITSGSLFVPPEKYAKEEGLKAKYIKAKNPELNHIVEKFKNDLDTDDVKLNWVGNQEPLFTHDPCAKDIIQGNVGDCYFVAALAAIVSKNPQAIRDMMTLNDDDSVTVRFYNSDNEPIYVTVENTIPVLTYKNEDGEYKTENALSFGARWVQIFEKAFNESGLPVPTKQNVEAITGGTLPFALKSLLGPQVQGLNIDDVADFQEIEIEPTVEKIFPDKYKQSDLDIFYRLKSLHESGKVLTTGAIDEDKRFHMGIDTTSLPGPHAYGIMGFSEEGGFKYIHIKNPHSDSGREYTQKHSPVMSNDVAGESKIELRDFLNNFYGATYAELNSTPINRLNEEMVAHESDIYADTIREMDYYLQGSNKIKADDENAPEQLMDLRKKSMLAADAIKDPHIKPDELHSILTDYFESAQTYVNYREQNPRSEEEEKSPYSAICYTSAEVINKLGKIFLSNLVEDLSKAEYVDPDVLKDEVLQASENDSFVKKCATEKVTEIKKEMQAAKQKEMADNAAKAKAKITSTVTILQ